MKKAAEYTLRVRKLFNRLKRSGAKSSLAAADGAMDVLLLGILSNFSTEQKAAVAIETLMAEMIDYNDLRVTPVADIVALIGIEFPHCRAAAEEISRVFTSIFNRTHDLDLGFLASFNKKPAASFLDSLDGLSPHAHAFFRNRFLKTHVIPLDANMYAYLMNNGCISEDLDVGAAQDFVSRVFKGRDAQSFYALLKRSSAAHAPRAAVGKSRTAGTTRKSAKRPTTKKKTAARKKRAKGPSKKSTSRKSGGRRRR